MDALGKPNKEPIRSALPKKPTPKYFMPLLSIGILLVFGSGLLWVVSGQLECTNEQKSIEPQQCSDITWMDKYMPIGMVIGFALLPLAIITTLGSDDRQSNREEKQ